MSNADIYSLKKGIPNGLLASPKATDDVKSGMPGRCLTPECNGVWGQSLMVSPTILFE